MSNLTDDTNGMMILPMLVSSISKKLILSENNDIDFYKIYITIPKHILNLAIEIAKVNVYELNKSFNILIR